MTEQERREEAAMNAASNAFHDHPNNPTSCLVYQQEFHGRRCPCEDDWKKYLNGREQTHQTAEH